MRNRRAIGTGHGAQLGLGVAVRREFLHELLHLRPADAAAVFDAQVEPRGVADAIDRGSIERENESVLNLRVFPAHFVQHRLQIAPARHAVRPRLEPREHHAVVRTVAGDQRKALERPGVIHAIGCEQDLLDLLDHRQRALLAGGVGHPNLRDDQALVLLGHEAGRHPRHAPIDQHTRNPEREQRRNNNDRPHQEARQPRIPAGDVLEHPIKSPLVNVGFFSGRKFTQNHPGQRGAQRQRAQCAEERAGGDRQRELPIQLPADPRQRRGRQEHRHQHQRNAHHRAEHLHHRLRCRLLRRQMMLRQIALHVLHHHDRIIHHDADRQNQTKQRRQIQTEAEQLHREERADQRHRNRHDRNHRRAHASQKHQHHQQH